MSVTVNLRLDLTSLDKPVIIQGRTHDLGGTDYWTMARVTIDDAHHLKEEGLKWWDKEPDWPLIHAEIGVLKAQAEARKAAQHLEDLKAART